MISRQIQQIYQELGFSMLVKNIMLILISIMNIVALIGLSLIGKMSLLMLTLVCIEMLAVILVLSIDLKFLAKRVAAMKMHSKAGQNLSTVKWVSVFFLLLGLVCSLVVSIVMGVFLGEGKCAQIITCANKAHIAWISSVIAFIVSALFIITIAYTIMKQPTLVKGRATVGGRIEDDQQYVDDDLVD